MVGQAWENRGEKCMEEKEYEITIREVLERKIKCKAKSEDEAMDLVITEYQEEKIVLGAEDYSFSEYESREVVPTKNKER